MEGWRTASETLLLGSDVGTDLLLLLAGQLHLLPLLLQLRGGLLLLLVVAGQKLLPQADQLTNHGRELALLLF